MTSQYTANFKSWDHTGHIVPPVEHGESHPIGAEFKPADWLPTRRYDKKVEAYVTIPAGKVVAVDRQGRVVPAGLKYVFEDAAGNTVLTYTATDVTEGVIDLTTGETVASATSYTQTQLTTALQGRGLITASETARDFISWPIGYAPYSYFKWAGGDGWNPTGFVYHNFNLQHQVAVGQDYALRLPMVPAVVTTETQGGGHAIANTAIVFGTGSWNSATGIHATAPYADLVAVGDNVVAMALNKWPVAKITINTAITDSGSMLASMTEVDSIAAVLAGGSGYFYIDYDRGVLFLYESGGNAIPTGFSTAATITYYSYEDTATGSELIAQALGNLKPGDLLTFDNKSNFVKWVPDIGTCYGGAAGDVYAGDPDYPGGTASTISAQLEAFTIQCHSAIIGQVVAIWAGPRSGLDYVRTQFSSLSAYERMPGSATDGMTDNLVQGGGANLEAVINFCAR